jgi:hypothetical protein
MLEKLSLRSFDEHLAKSFVFFQILGFFSKNIEIDAF